MNIFTLSNFITFVRLLLLYPIIYFYEIGETTLSLYAILVAASTDFFDGWIARKTNTVSEFGKIFDPLIDKIVLGILVVYYWQKGNIPLWLLVMVLSRDVIIFVGGMYISAKKKITLMSLPLGKWAVTILAITFVVCMYDDVVEGIKYGMCIVSAVFLVCSFLQYVYRFIQVVKS